MIARYHVHFDGEPDIRMHVCALHRAIGQTIPCDQDQPNADGDCAHVQTRRCTCADPPQCTGCCWDEGEWPT